MVRRHHHTLLLILVNFISQLPESLPSQVGFGLVYDDVIDISSSVTNTQPGFQYFINQTSSQSLTTNPLHSSPYLFGKFTFTIMMKPGNKFTLSLASNAYFNISTLTNL